MNLEEILKQKGFITEILLSYDIANKFTCKLSVIDSNPESHTVNIAGLRLKADSLPDLVAKIESEMRARKLITAEPF